MNIYTQIDSYICTYVYEYEQTVIYISIKIDRQIDRKTIDIFMNKIDRKI